jgi:hypothetical protein
MARQSEAMQAAVRWAHDLMDVLDRLESMKKPQLKQVVRLLKAGYCTNVYGDQDTLWNVEVDRDVKLDIESALLDIANRAEWVAGLARSTSTDVEREFLASRQK